MTSEEKSTWLVAGSLVLVYGWYFLKVFRDAAGTPVGDIGYQELLVVMVAVFVAVVVVSHIVVAILSRQDDGPDERDRRVDRFGEYIGGYVLGTGCLVVLVLAMSEVEHFWIAHAILGVLVLSELVTDVVKIIVYRRGFWVGSKETGYELG